MAQNVKNLCLSHLIFQEPYIIWSSFMVHMNVLKDNISKHFFHFFQNFDFRDHYGGRGEVKGQKMAQSDKTFLSVSLYPRNCTSYDCDCWCTWVKWWYLQQIDSFFKILILGLFREIKAKNNIKLPISVCFALYLRNCM